MRQVLILRSPTGSNPANFTVPLNDNLPILGEIGTEIFDLRLEEVVLQPTNGQTLPTTPFEVRVTLGTPGFVYDTRGPGRSNTVGFVQNFEGSYEHPWIRYSAGHPFSQVGVNIVLLDGTPVPNLLYSVVTLTLKSLT